MLAAPKGCEQIQGAASMQPYGFFAAINQTRIMH